MSFQIKNITVPFLLIIIFSGALFSFLPYGYFIQKFTLILFFFLAFHDCFNRKILLPHGLKKYIVAYLFFIVYAGFSSFFYSQQIVYTFYVVQQYIFSLLIFLVVILIYNNLILSRSLIYLDRFIISFVFIQFLAVLFKFLYFGKINEGFMIGTLHHYAGQLGFLIPAVLIPLVIYRFSQRSIFLVITLITMCFLFGVINEKRSILYLGPIIIILSLRAMSFFKLSLQSLYKLVLIPLLFLIALLLSNQYESFSSKISDFDHSSDVEYFFAYSMDYLTMKPNSALQGDAELAYSDKAIQFGRVALFLELADAFSTLPIQEKLFGLGMGSFSDSDNLAQDDMLFSKFGFRGAISGLWLWILEGGLFVLLFGVFLFLYPLRILVKCRRYAIRLADFNSFKLVNILLIIQFIFVFDFLLYSTLSTYMMPIVFFYFLQLMAVYLLFNFLQFKNKMAL